LTETKNEKWNEINFWSSTKQSDQPKIFWDNALLSLPGPEVVEAFESETDVTTADLFKADAKTEVVESFERSKP
jgi:hypothetical protein